VTRQRRLEEISVIIPTLGREILQKALASIAKGSAWPAQVIVVDQSSSSTVAAWLQPLSDLGIRTEHVPSNQTGRARGVNRGIERTGTTFFAVTDDDCLVERESPTPAVHRRPRLSFDSLSGGNMGTSLAVVERVGLLDEDACVATAEDGEWAYRALRAGVPIVYAPDVVVSHVGWRNAAERAAQYASYARSHGGFYGKYLARGDAFIALRALLHELRALRRWLRGAWSGDQDLALNGRAYFTGLLPGVVAGIRSQRALRTEPPAGT
jgi:GT2 family glycosyltransferase